jgi:hypothetical protein
MSRDYKKEYAKYHGTKKYKEERASRNGVRRKMEASGRVRKHDGMDVDHRNGNPRDNRMSNLRIITKSANRSKH